MTRISQRQQKRITESVKWTERQTRGDARNPRWRHRDIGAMPLICFTQADIEHGESGPARFAEGDFDGFAASTDSDDDVTIYNARDKLWNGAQVLAVWPSFRLASGSTNDGTWLVMQAWSATRVRGVSQAAIAPGTTGTLGTLKPLNGIFQPLTLSAFLPTAHVSIESGLAVWVELVFNATTGISRWEVYSADCIEAGP